MSKKLKIVSRKKSTEVVQGVSHVKHQTNFSKNVLRPKTSMDEEVKILNATYFDVNN